LPSPLWGRGWPASGVLTSRGGTGEGVNLERLRKNRSEQHWGRLGKI
jgi:hypothetical protein